MATVVLLEAARHSCMIYEPGHECFKTVVKSSQVVMGAIIVILPPLAAFLAGTDSRTI